MTYLEHWLSRHQIVIEMKATLYGKSLNERCTSTSIPLIIFAIKENVA